MPKLFHFLGDDGITIMKHLRRFLLLYGEVGANDFLKFKVFANSLTRFVFSWYVNLSPNSIFTW